jgi:saccharopine dehydrogenase-like NADP-dependent oxidoreductase
MVGSVMAADLASDPGFAVTVADKRPGALELARVRAARVSDRAIETVEADLGDPASVTRLASGYDIVLGALSSRIGLQTLRAVIEAGKNYCDISFMAEDALALSDLAKTRGVTAVVDMGVAPGMSNLLAGYAARALSPCENIEIYVGGLPKERRWPFQYKAGFSPADVIEEYTRPSRIVEHGRVVVKPALSEPELLDVPGVGTLEAFNTDGLRSIATTLRVPSMKEKTMRYPGHIELMRAFRETGLFSEKAIEVPCATGHGMAQVRPLDVISTLMFPMWTYEEGEPDLTVMRVLADGVRDGKRVRMVWDVLDELDPKTKFTSMARTTAFPCTIVARLIAAGKIGTKGVLAPEQIAEEWLVRHLFAELERRGVRYREGHRER